MDPGGKIYTIDEFRCWKVENLDDVRSDENKNRRTKRGGFYCQYIYIYIYCMVVTCF